jgi:hypothetical protein
MLSSAPRNLAYDQLDQSELFCYLTRRFRRRFLLIPRLLRAFNGNGEAAAAPDQIREGATTGVHP